MSIYDAAKDVAGVLKEAGKIKEYQQILDLIDDLFKKRDEIKCLTEENCSLKEKLRVSTEYKFGNNSYWSMLEHDGPFCSRCFDKNKDLIRLIPDMIGSNYATCPECKCQVNYTGREDSAMTSTYSPDFE